MGACSMIPSALYPRRNPCSPEFPHCYRRGWRRNNRSDGRTLARPPTRIRVVDGGAELVAPPEITWQIVVGSLAGVTPFVVAGIEFSKRIMAQRQCGVCGGSGLVQRDGYCVKCPGCGGFLPWQSWKRFFTG